nr:hypothetical protein [uncultured Enterobacter sp.]
MSIKDFILIIISRLVAGTGMTMGLIGTIYAFWNIFFSDDAYRFLLGAGGVLGVFVGYGLYKFAITCIYDEWDHYR